MIVLSVPYYGEKSILSPSDYPGSDYIEYRLDYTERPDLVDLTLFDNKTILTVRDTGEGGKNQFSRDFKLKLYKDAIRKSNVLVDDEIIHYLQEAPDLPADNLILSWHAQDDKAVFQQLKKTIARANQLQCRFLKINIPIEKYSDLESLEECLRQSVHPVLITASGYLGKLARLLYAHLGGVGTYVGLKDMPTASSQLTYRESMMLNLPKYSKQTMLFGIVGGDQVWNSMGLSYYNELFSSKNINATYLPFIVNDCADFLEWLKKHTATYNILGISITSPWKSTMASLLEAEDRIINCYLPHRHGENIRPWALNSDRSAMLQSLKMLDIDVSNNILIYGTGAMAELTLSLMKGYQSVYIYGRNGTRVEELAAIYGCTACSRVFMESNTWDLLVNCTTIGMMGESFRMGTGSFDFRKAIDLPYANEETELAIYCTANEIPCVTGKEFWEMQRETQEELFLAEVDRLDGWAEVSKPSGQG